MARKQQFLKGKGKILVDAIVLLKEKLSQQQLLICILSALKQKCIKQFEEAGSKEKPVVQIPPQAYIPIPMGIEKWLINS